MTGQGARRSSDAGHRHGGGAFVRHGACPKPAVPSVLHDCHPPPFCCLGNGMAVPRRSPSRSGSEHRPLLSLRSLHQATGLVTEPTMHDAGKPALPGEVGDGLSGSATAGDGDNPTQGFVTSHFVTPGFVTVSHPRAYCRSCPLTPPPTRIALDAPASIPTSQPGPGPGETGAVPRPSWRPHPVRNWLKPPSP